MPTAILIAFEYRINHLPCAFVDLSTAYRWCEACGYISHILTDIKQFTPQTTSNFPKVNIIMDSNSLRLALKSINIPPDDKLFVYYSGHGLVKSIILPDASVMLYRELKNLVLANTRSTTEIVWISDCCNSDNLSLPYKLICNNFILSSKSIEFISQKLLLITSSDTSEKAIATREGSLFTHYLFEFLHNISNTKPMPYITLPLPLAVNKNLSRFKGKISSKIRSLNTGYSQTISIYSSYIIDPVFSTWLYNFNRDITTDYTLTTLILHEKSNNCGDLKLIQADNSDITHKNTFSDINTCDDLSLSNSSVTFTLNTTGSDSVDVNTIKSANMMQKYGNSNKIIDDQVNMNDKKFITVNPDFSTLQSSFYTTANKQPFNKVKQKDIIVFNKSNLNKGRLCADSFSADSPSERIFPINKITEIRNSCVH
jgi:hypothetical protein